MRRPASGPELFREVLTAGINDLAQHGFDSQKRLDEWLKRIEIAARAALVPESVLDRSLRDMLQRVYQRTVESGRFTHHKGLDPFTLAHIKPKLRAELDRRILASASLIKLNREASIQRTLQRFSGWATSIPIGGTDVADKGETKEKVRRGIAGLPFVERRVIIDQGHKLTAAINDIVATDGGAIAAKWRHVREGGGYQARPRHVARDGKIYVIRDNWALRKGLMKPGGAQYTDDITTPGEEVFCRCSYEYLYALRDLPEHMLTVKGKKALAKAQAELWNHALYTPK